MEQPYKGRAIITDYPDTREITIPARKNWFVIIFLCVWLCGWCLGELFAVSMLFGLFTNGAGFFVLFWLIGWTIGGALALRTFLWNIRGKEVVVVGQGKLSLYRDGDIFFQSKIYDLGEVKDMRVLDMAPWGNWGMRGDIGINLSRYGLIRFDYGFKTIKFASGIDEAEAKYLLEKILEKAQEDSMRISATA